MIPTFAEYKQTLKGQLNEEHMKRFYNNMCFDYIRKFISLYEGDLHRKVDTEQPEKFYEIAVTIQSLLGIQIHTAGEAVPGVSDDLVSLGHITGRNLDY